MTTLTFPTLSRSVPEFSFGQLTNTMAHTSPLSSSVQTVEMPAPRWQFRFPYANLEEADAALVQGFITQLRGRAGRFYMHNLARPTPRGIATGTPLVNGASQTGTSVITNGWAISQTGILKIGDFFKIGNELKIVVSADVNSDGGGNATIVFEPPIRTSPTTGTAVVVSQPTATFMLAADDNTWRTVAPVWTSFELQGIEAL